MNKLVYVVGILLVGCVVTFFIWMGLHERKTKSGYARLGKTEAKIEAVVGALDLDMMTVTAPDGRVFVIVRSPNEKIEDWYARADAVQSGAGAASLNCATLHCTNGTVEICIACMVGETPDHCDERLEHAVDVYCQTHTCDECSWIWELLRPMRLAA